MVVLRDIQVKSGMVGNYASALAILNNSMIPVQAVGGLFST